MSKYEPPGYDVPLVDPRTGLVSPDWYAFLTKRGVLDMPDVTGAPTNTQVLVWDATLKKFKPGAN